MTDNSVVKAWGDFQAKAGFRRPRTETDYLELINVMHYLLDHYDCDEEPYASLLDLVGTYMHAWELEHEPDLKNPEVAPHAMLAYLMEQHGVSQYQLAKEGLVNQGNLSKILKGERGISKKFAKRLAERFGVSVELFL